MRHDLVLPAEVHQECRRRIEARYHSVNRTVALGDGGAPAFDMLTDIERLRACEAYLLGQTPIPVSYRSDHFWHGYPPGFRFVHQTTTESAPAQPAQSAYAPPPYYPPYPAPAAPQIIVIPQGGGTQQVVNTGTPGAPSVVNAPAQPMPAAAGFAHVPQGVPYAHSHQFPAVQPGSPTGMQEGHPRPHAAVSAAPGFSTVAPPPHSQMQVEPEIIGPNEPLKSAGTWTETKEALFNATLEALKGNQAFCDLLKPFADREGMELIAFCHRVGGERAEALNHFAARNAA